MATLVENANAVKAASTAIDAAILAKGGTTSGGLLNAAAAIAALPSGGGGEDLLNSVLSGTLSSDGEIVIAATSVKQYALYGNTGVVKKITLPNVTYLPGDCFDGSNYTEINLPNVTSSTARGMYINNFVQKISVPKLVSVPAFWNWGGRAVREVHLDSCVSIHVSNFLKFGEYVQCDFYLPSMEYNADSTPSGFPWQVIKDYSVFHFANNTTVAYVNGAWTIVED